MYFDEMTDIAILKEIGSRLKKERLNQNITQSHLAKTGGITRTALQRLEKGKGCTLLTLVKILRGINRLSLIDTFLPDPGLSPVQLAQLHGKIRQRASGKHKKGND